MPMVQPASYHLIQSQPPRGSAARSFSRSTFVTAATPHGRVSGPVPKDTSQGNHDGTLTGSVGCQRETRRLGGNSKDVIHAIMSSRMAVWMDHCLCGHVNFSIFAWREPPPPPNPQFAFPPISDPLQDALHLPGHVPSQHKSCRSHLQYNSRMSLLIVCSSPPPPPPATPSQASCPFPPSLPPLPSPPPLTYMIGNPLR